MVRKEKQDQALPDPKWLMPEALAEILIPMVPPDKPKGPGTKGGRPSVSPRRLLDAIFYLLRTGGQWQSIPRSLAAGSTAHDYFQRLVREGVFEKLWQAALAHYDGLKGLDWKWLTMDGAMSKAPLGGALLVRTRPTARRRGPSARS